MRRLNLSTKMLVAALPLILAVAALLALTVRSDLADIDQAEKGAELGAMWTPITTALSAIEHESDPAMATDDDARSATDAAISALSDETDRLGAVEAARDHMTSARAALSSARRSLDMVTLAPDLKVQVDPAEAYADASREIVAIGQLLPAEAGDPELGRELLAVVKLAEARLAADSILHDVAAWQVDPTDLASLQNARTTFGTLETKLGEFDAIAPQDWAVQFRDAGFALAVANERLDVDQAVRTIQAGNEGRYDPTNFAALVEGGVGFQQQITGSIVERAQAEADATRSSTLRRTAIIVGVGALAVLLAWLIARSITKRIRKVARGAQQVTDEQLPALVTALRDPRNKGDLPKIAPIPVHGTDELNELAAAFNSMQDTLVDVAHEQVEVLRRGVSDIFVTMARRNRSLIDRQLAMLDEFEAEVDDPDVLANYYQLDHMATRMRRNSESLLVLANAEPKRRRVKATEVDDVVRAAIGEVEDYRRIEIEALESLQVRGNVVADISHLLAELLDNATSFSPPDSYVRVGGRMTDNGYMIRILDTGVGIGSDRLKQLNALLREPPIVGLSVESTLGMSVVSLLANKHGITVTLAAGNPGLIVDVLLPPSLFGPIDAQLPLVANGTTGQAVGSVGGAAPTLPAAAPGEQIVAWDDAGAPDDESFEQAEPEPMPAAPSPTPIGYHDDDDRPVAASDWRKMSLNLAAFQSGVQAASNNGDGRTDAGAEVHGDEVAGVDEVVETDEVVADQMPDAPVLGADQSVDDELERGLSTADDGVPHDDMADEDADEQLVEQVDNEPDTSFALAGSLDQVGHPADTVEESPESLAGTGPDVGGDEASDVRDPDRVRADASPVAPSPAVSPNEAPVAATNGDVTGDDIADLAAMVGADEPDEAPTPSLGGMAFDAPTLPPPSAAPASAGEFDVPPAPPFTAASPSRRPVAPSTAQRAPQPEDRDLTPRLPTRTPGQGPDGGPDRLSDGAPRPFGADADDLPTRARVGDPLEPIEEPLATTAAANPEALRDRLRAFQAEFRSALGTDSHDDQPSGHDEHDLGGDR